MGYTGAKLAPLFSTRLTRQTAHRLAAGGRDLLHDETVQNTPIDDSPYPSRRPGTARASWRKQPVSVPVRTPAGEVYTTGIISHDEVTSYLEYGTGLHGPYHRVIIIRPKHPDGMLRFWSRRDGRWVFAKEVRHPGIHAQRPLATGAALAEHRMAEKMMPVLEAWRVAWELEARVAARVR